MAIFTNSVGQTNTTGNTFYTWAKPVSNFFATAGWIQGSDTGQVVWPVSIFNLVSAANSGGTSEIFTYTAGSGAIAPQIGSSVIIKGCTTSGLNVTALVTAIGTNTFTIANTSAVSETETANTAWAVVNPQVKITSLTVASNVITFTFTAFDGTIRAGESIVVLGTSGGTYDATYVITGVVGNTFTAATGAGNVGATAETATGIVTATPAVINTGASGTTTMPPAASNALFEIWKMGDGNALPCVVKIGYGSTSAAAIDPQVYIQVGTSTDGASNITGTASSQITVFNNTATNNTSGTNSYMSGSTNRIILALWPGDILAAHFGLFAVERSHDQNGNDTSAYFTVAMTGGSTTSEFSISASAITTVEAALPVVSKHSTLTASFGSSVLMSPVFPVVGAVGNPMLGLLVGKTADWADQIQFPFTMYNTSHNYIVFSSPAVNVAGGAVCYDTTATCALAMRYE